MTGRLPYHVNQIILSDSAVDLNAPKEMTAMPRKLKEGGYSTHMVGKWHVGLDHPSATPHGRGFDTSMGYLTAAEDHWTQALANACPATSCPATAAYPANEAAAYAGFGNGSNVIDMWCTDRPCTGLNGTAFHMGRNGMVQGSLTSFGDYQYAQEAIRIIKEHDTDIPMFFYVAFQCNHLPLEAPDSFIEMYPDTWRDDRRWYAAMTSYFDVALGNITDAMKARNMWENTLLVFTTDK